MRTNPADSLHLEAGIIRTYERGRRKVYGELVLRRSVLNLHDNLAGLTFDGGEGPHAMVEYHINEFAPWNPSLVVRHPDSPPSINEPAHAKTASMPHRAVGATGGTTLSVPVPFARRLHPIPGGQSRQHPHIVAWAGPSPDRIFVVPIDAVARVITRSVSAENLAAVSLAAELDIHLGRYDVPYPHTSIPSVVDTFTAAAFFDTFPGLAPRDPSGL